MTEDIPQFRRRQVAEYFREGEWMDWAVQALRVYCRGQHPNGGPEFTGSCFEQLAGSDPHVVSADDLVAVSTLGVDVPGRAAIWILGDGRDEISAHLRGIPQIEITSDDEREVDEARAALTDDGPADKLWRLMNGQNGLGPVKTSKILATKRPGLLPVYDQHVANALELPNDRFWLPMWQSMQEAREQVGEAVREAKVDVSLLRAADIVIWMHEHGWTFALDGELRNHRPS